MRNTPRGRTMPGRNARQRSLSSFSLRAYVGDGPAVGGITIPWSQ
jgi:hypothetical protein